MTEELAETRKTLEVVVVALLAPTVLAPLAATEMRQKAELVALGEMALGELPVPVETKTPMAALVVRD